MLCLRLFVVSMIKGVERRETTLHTRPAVRIWTFGHCILRRARTDRGSFLIQCWFCHTSPHHHHLFCPSCRSRGRNLVSDTSAAVESSGFSTGSKNPRSGTELFAPGCAATKLVVAFSLFSRRGDMRIGSDREHSPDRGNHHCPHGAGPG